MRPKNLFFILIIFASLGLTATFIFLKKPPSDTTYTYDDITGRTVIYREYSPYNETMDLMHGEKKYVINNTSFLKTEDIQPYFLNLKDYKSNLVIEFKRPQSQKPHVKSLNDPLTFKQGIYENTSSDIIYKGSWIIQKRDGPSDNTVHTAIEKNSLVEFTFMGTALEIGLVKYDDRINAELCIDDACKILNLYSEKIVWQSPYLITGLNNKKHNASLRLVNGKAIDIDWIRIIDNQNVLTSKNYQSWYDLTTLSTGWNKAKNYLGENIYRSPRGYAKIGFEVLGKNITIVFDTNIEGSEAEICVNKNCETLSLISFTPDKLAHEIKLSNTKADHVTITKKQGRFIEIKKIVVE